MFSRSAAPAPAHAAARRRGASPTRAPPSGRRKSLSAGRSAVTIQMPTTFVLDGQPGVSTPELLCVFGVQSLPAAELHRIASNDASDRSSAEKVVQNIDTNVPPGSTHCDEAAIDVVPQRQARAATEGFEFPPDIPVAPVVLENAGSVGSRHFGFGNERRGRSHRGELHRGSNRSEAPIGVEGRPLAQMRWLG